MTYKVINHDEDKERNFQDEEDARDVYQLLQEGGIDATLEVPESKAPTEAKADGGVVAKETPPESEIQSSEEFVTEIAGVPPAFVMEMGDSPYITKEGLNYLANKQGLEVRSEPITPSWEDNDTVAYRGIVEDPEGRRWEDVGTAHAGTETVGDTNLDEVASTRATNRALRLATGCGLCSMEELAEGAENAVREDADVIEAEVVEE